MPALAADHGRGRCDQRGAAAGSGRGNDRRPAGYPAPVRGTPGAVRRPVGRMP